MRGMSKKRIPLTEQIRRAVAGCGESRYMIAKATGVDAAALCRFMQGGGLSMESLDALAEHLGLRIVVDRPAKKAKKGD
jgi:hypothetical protein